MHLLLWYEKADACKNWEQWERRLLWGGSLPRHLLSLRWRHQAVLSLVPCPGAWLLEGKTFTINQQPLLLETSGPTGFQPTCGLAIQSACPCLSTGKLWDILSVALLRRKEITCTDLLRVGCFTRVGHAEQEQFPHGKSMLFLLIVLSFMYLAQASVSTRCTILSRKWG